MPYMKYECNRTTRNTSNRAQSASGRSRRKRRNHKPKTAIFKRLITFKRNGIMQRFIRLRIDLGEKNAYVAAGKL